MKEYLSLVKFSHTIFAMPFALVGAFLAFRMNDIAFAWPKLILVILCMVFARNAAMAFNRYLDKDIDMANDRTRSREIPSGLISAQSALTFVLANCALFILTTWFINLKCFALSPIALLVILGYSYTKRFTFLCHVVLGLGLALAPIGSYLAVANEFNVIPVLYGLVVLFWVAGFDIIYALQDESFDKGQNLHSIPVLLGKTKALMLSRVFHVIALSILICAAILLKEFNGAVEILHWTGVLIFGGLLIYQHGLVKPNDLRKINLAFFTTNGVASVVFGLLLLLDLYF